MIALAVIQAAEDLAASGVPVFPLRENKRPATLHGFKDAVIDPAAVAPLWRRFPGPLIGVPTGAASGIDTLDIDPRHGGGLFWATHRGRIWQTRLHRTRSGGLHVFFRHDHRVRNSASRIAPGVDVRGGGGFVVWWPAAGFQVLDRPIAPWPAWLLEQVIKPVSRPERPVPAEPVLVDQFGRMGGFVARLLANVAAAPEGAKHGTLLRNALSLGGVLDAAGLTEEGAVALLVGALPDTVLDWENARRTALYGVQHGRARPLRLEDRARG